MMKRAMVAAALALGGFAWAVACSRSSGSGGPAPAPGPIAGLGASLTAALNEVSCPAWQQGAKFSLGCLHTLPCHDGGSATASVGAVTRTATSSSTLVLGGNMVVSFNNCTEAVSGSALTLNGGPIVVYLNKTIVFVPTASSAWLALTVSGNEIFNNASFRVTAGTSTFACSAGGSTTWLNNVLQPPSALTGTVSYTGASGCVAGQSGAVSASY